MCFRHNEVIPKRDEDKLHSIISPRNSGFHTRYRRRNFAFVRSSCTSPLPTRTPKETGLGVISAFQVGREDLSGLLFEWSLLLLCLEFGFCHLLFLLAPVNL